MPDFIQDAEENLQFWQNCLSGVEGSINGAILKKNLIGKSEFLEELIKSQCDALIRISNEVGSAKRMLSDVKNNNYEY